MVCESDFELAWQTLETDAANKVDTFVDHYSSAYIDGWAISWTLTENLGFCEKSPVLKSSTL